MKKAAVVFGKILLGILTFILCVALVFSTIVTIVTADIQVITDKDNLNTLITGFLTGSGPKKGAAGLPIAGVHHAPNRRLNADDGSELSGFGFSGSDTGLLVEIIYDLIEQEAGGEELPFTLEEVEAFVEESTFDDFLAEKGAGLVSDMITGEKTTIVTIEEIEQVLKENAALIEQTFDVPTDNFMFVEVFSSEIEKTGILEQLNEGGLEKLIQMSNGEQLAPEDGNDSSSPDVEEESDTNTAIKEMTIVEIIKDLLNGAEKLSKMSFSQLLDVFRTVFSAKTMWMCIGVCVVLIGLIFLTRWKKYYIAMIVTGVTLLITGVICMAPAVVFWGYPDAVANLVPGVKAMLKMVAMIVDMTYPISLGVGIFGLVLIVAGCVLSAFSKKWAKAKTAPAVEAEQVAAEEVVEVTAEETTEVAEEVPEVAEQPAEVAEETPEVAEQPAEVAEEPAAAAEEPTEV